MTCNNCDSTSIVDIALDVENVVVCKDCGYGRPSLREPMQYEDSYEAKYLAYPEKDICVIRLRVLRILDSGLATRRQKLLDYGCGSGAFVRAARAAGYDAYGFDVNDFTADLRPPEGFTPDIITAWDAFEHLTDEQQKIFFQCANTANTIAVSVPDFFTPTKDETLKKWRHYRPREHLHYYTLTALCTRFEREGYSFGFSSHAEDAVRKAPWKNNILTVGFVKKAAK